MIKEWLQSLPQALSIFIMVVAFVLLVIAVYAVLMGILHLMCLPPMLRCYVDKSLKKLVPIPKYKIGEKNEFFYKLMKNMWVDTDSLAFSPRKKDMGYYFDFLMCKLTCYHPHGKVKVSEEWGYLFTRKIKSGLYENTYLISDEGKENWWILKFNHSGSLRFRFKMTRTDRCIAEQVIEEANGKGGILTD